MIDIDKLKTWDSVEHLETKEDIAYYLEAVLEEDDPQLLIVALGDIARSQGMTEVAKAVGVTRASLYKSLSADGNPSAITLLKVISALGIKLNPKIQQQPTRKPRAIKREVATA